MLRDDNYRGFNARRDTRKPPPPLAPHMRQEIVDKYEAALLEEPSLTKSEFARRTALAYGVSAATIRRTIT